jgi:hypothetical protein
MDICVCGMVPKVWRKSVSKEQEMRHLVTWVARHYRVTRTAGGGTERSQKNQWHRRMNWLVGSVCTDTLSVTRLCGVDDQWMIMNWKGFGRKWSWTNFKEESWHSSGGTEENHNQDRQFAGARIELRTYEYEIGVLNTLPRRWVTAERRRREVNMKQLLG